DTPVGGHRAAGPDRTGFAGRLVANGKDEVHLRRARFGKLVPAFAAQPARLEMSLFEEVERRRVHGTLGKAAGAVGLEPLLAPVLEKRLGHDAPGVDPVSWTPFHL